MIYRMMTKTPIDRIDATELFRILLTFLYLIVVIIKRRFISCMKSWRKEGMSFGLINIQ